MLPATVKTPRFNHRPFRGKPLKEAASTTVACKDVGYCISFKGVIQLLSVLFVFFFTAINKVVAQQDSFDIVKYTPLKGWKKDVKEYLTSYSSTDAKTGGWCVISIVKSTVSKGSIETDFDSEWNEFVVRSYEAKDPPQTDSVHEADGWKIKSGGGKFIYNKANAMALLTTMSGYDRCVSIVATTNSQQYIDAIQNFLSSLDLKKPPVAPRGKVTQVSNALSNNTGGKKSAFAFTTTNWDDGWVSVEKEDWVEITKGNIRILLHYKHPQADAYNSDLMAGEKNAWNILVAPRYSAAANMNFKPHFSWQSIEFADADLTEASTGKKMYVVFFKKHYSNGSGTHLEFIAPDRPTFEKEFGTYNSEETWDKVERMAGYNRFAIGAADLGGTWTNNFSGMTQYVNAYTGASAGADTHASAQKFEFGANNTYKWDIGVASGFVGSIKFQSAKANGKYTVVNPWQIDFSEMEGKPKSFNAYFSCSKDARVLWLQDKSYGGYDAFGKAN
ncbi:MAG: hypothetical protein JWR61_2864 [Ferruginibacter sp.]|uniref:hypothetical protein n=1 Tax=Ferruginibacter sp. TaxID=1940288 RepID=UPI00265B61E2|nr:hypothetical protein [Ferruginibacter sp.]MDB5277909.1 hypothetical protein [Ferruginibacter sp.]